MSDYIKREDATAVIRKTLGSLGNSVVTEINSLSGYATQDYARFTQESTQDLISRQAAIRWVKTECNPYGKPTLDFESGKKVIEHLKQMPSADRPTGEWEVVDATEPRRYGCSKCKRLSWDMSNFCPNCGAKMEGGEEE